MERVKKLLLEGKSLCKEQTVDIDFAKLTPEQRALMLDNCKLNGNCPNLFLTSYEYFSSDERTPFNNVDEIDAYGLDELFIKFAEMSAKKKKEKEQKEAAAKAEQDTKDKAVAANRQLYWNNRQATVTMLTKYKTYYYSKLSFDAIRIPLDEDTKAFIEQIKTELIKEEEDHKAQEKAAKEKQEQEEKEARAKRNEELKIWALQNGSELVKLRIEEDMNWHELADADYFKSIQPEGFVNLREPDESWPINNATMSQILALRSMRLTHPDAKLMWYKYVEEREYGDNDVRHEDVIVITLTSLSGNTKIFEKPTPKKP